MNGNWIKLHRSMMDHAIWGNEWLVKLFIWCLFRCRFRDAGSGETTLLRGQFITGRKRAAIELEVSESRFYRGIKRLEKLGCIVVKSNNERTIITVSNYESYQKRKRRKIENRTTIEQQSNTIEEGKKDITIINDPSGLPKIDNPILKREKREKKIFIPPTLEEVTAYCKERDNDIDSQKWIDYWSEREWTRKGNKKIIDWKATLRLYESCPHRVKKKLNYCPTLEEARKVWTPAYNPDQDERFNR